jgi:hypothetical protein
MTLLATINRAQDKLSLPRSTVVVSSTDQNVRTLLAVANEEGKDLMKRYPWQALTKEHTFTATAAAVQTDGIPADIGSPMRFVTGTFFNRTNHRRVTGPLTAEEWQAQLALTANLLTDSFRVRGGSMLITPTPAGTETYAYEYVSAYWVDTDDDGDGDANAWDADDDVGMLSEDIMLLGIVWRWRKAKGLDYAEDFNTYEMAVTDAIIRDGSKRTVSYAYDMSIYDNARPPGVPEGDWSL